MAFEGCTPLRIGGNCREHTVNAQGEIGAPGLPRRGRLRCVLKERQTRDTPFLGGGRRAFLAEETAMHEKGMREFPLWLSGNEPD